MRTLVFAFFCFIAFNSFSCELTVRLEHYAPETSKTNDGSWSGMDIDITRSLFEEAQCQFSIVEVSWARSLIMLADGSIDLMINVSKTPIRSRSFYFIGPIRSEVIVLATNDDAKFSLKKISDITKLDKPIAIQRNAYYGPAIENLLKQKKYQEHFIHVTDNTTKLKLLKRGRISGFLEAKRNIINGVNSNANFEGIWYQPLVFHSNPIYVALSKKSVNNEVKGRIETAFERLITQGEIAAIDAKYEPKLILPELVNH
jgi:polar amino acid transport system substrate-binding protein